MIRLSEPLCAWQLTAGWVPWNERASVGPGEGKWLWPSGEACSVQEYCRMEPSLPFHRMAVGGAEREGNLTFCVLECPPWSEVSRSFPHPCKPLGKTLELWSALINESDQLSVL